MYLYEILNLVELSAEYYVRCILYLRYGYYFRAHPLMNNHSCQSSLCENLAHALGAGVPVIKRGRFALPQTLGYYYD